MSSEDRDKSSEAKGKEDKSTMPLGWDSKRSLLAKIDSSEEKSGRES